MPFTTVGDAQIYYEIRGQGPRLLYLGGSGADLRRTPGIFDSPLAAEFEVLALDHRGGGQTVAVDRSWTMADYADDAAGLLDAVGWESGHVVGVSFGGMVAQELALRHPQRVRRVVMCCSSNGGAGGKSYPIEEFQPLPPEERARRHMPVQDMRLDATWQAAHKEEWEEMLARRSGGGALDMRQLHARAEHDTYDRLPQLTMPVFVCGGSYDGQAPVANQQAIHAQIAGSKLQFFEGGHGFLNQDPAAYRAVAEFLAEA